MAKPTQRQSPFKMGNKRAMPWSSEVYPPAPKKTCRVCRKKITTPRRRTLCSEACSQAYMEAGNWNVLRRAVYKRDKGICQICRVDTRKLKHDWLNERPDWQEFSSDRAYQKARTKWLAKGEALVGSKNTWRSFWDCDHIKPVCEHVGDENPHLKENLRVLCIKCHGVVTKKLMRKRCKQRRRHP